MIKYNLTKEDIIQIRLDELEKTKSFFTRNGKIPFLIIFSVIVSFIYIQIAPVVGSSIDNKLSPNFDLFLTYFIQFPLCTLLLYLFLRFLQKNISKSVIDKIKKNINQSLSENDIGKRCIIKENSKIIFKGTAYTYEFDCDFISDIKERKYSYVILHQKQPLFILPKKACTYTELKKIIFEQEQST